MVNKCCVVNCNRSGGHKFPEDPLVRKEWIHAVKRQGKNKTAEWVPGSRSIVCHKHFRPDDYLDGSTTAGSLVRKYRRLKPSAVPSLFAWTKPTSERSKQRDERTQNRHNIKQQPQPGQSVEILDSDSGCSDAEESIGVPESIDVAEVVASADGQIATCAAGGCEESGSEDGLLLLQNPNQNVDVNMESEDAWTQTVQGSSPPPFLSIETLQLDPELLHYYTGLESFEKFQAVFQTLGPAVNHLTYLRTQTVKNLSPANQFLLMVTKLRQDLDYLPLSRMFGVSVFTADNVFCTWVNFCSRQWGEIDTWVSQELVRYFAPSDFKAKFPTTRVILDGTEIPVEKPSNPSSQRATFSTYKNTNTVKSVIGVTPGGLVSYVSPAYGGSTSDRQIIERGDLPQQCTAGDSVMADKGFNVQDIFAPFDVQVNIPAFFTKKNRLTEQQVLRDRKVSSKRVHIKRAIGMAKTYKILVNGLSAAETKLSCHIIFVCFALCNFRKNVVSADA